MRAIRTRDLPWALGSPVVAEILDRGKSLPLALDTLIGDGEMITLPTDDAVQPRNK